MNTEIMQLAAHQPHMRSASGYICIKSLTEHLV